MVVRSDQTEAGKFYRRTRNESAGGYFMRPKTLSASAYVAKIRRKVNPWTREVYLVQRLKADPTMVLLRRFIRGTDLITGQRWEFPSYVLVPADLVLREVKARPGYK